MTVPGPLPGAVPQGMRLGLGTQAPECQTRLRDSNYAARPPGLGIEVGVPQEAADEYTNFILRYVCNSYTVPGVPQAGHKKVAVPCEERGIPLSSQQNDNLLILQALLAKVETNLSCRYSPSLK
jgi:hypothetical protein